MMSGQFFTTKTTLLEGVVRREWSLEATPEDLGVKKAV